MTPRIVALVPMRDQSERVPGKNYRPFAGRPLFHHIVETLLACPEIAEMAIDTDSPTIMESVARHFPQVRLIERPESLRGGAVPMNDILLYDTSQIQADFYLQTHSTNPLLRTKTVREAIQLLQSNYPIYDSLFAVTRIQARLWDHLTRPVNHNPAILLRTQDLPGIFLENSCLYLFTAQVLQQRHNRIGERPLMFEMDRIESLDIDEEVDFRMAEVLFKERSGAQ